MPDNAKGGNGADRRQHPRLLASDLPGITARLSKGPAVVLQDVSRSGARFQCDSRLTPGLSIALRIVTPDGQMDVRGKVVRSRVIRKDHGELSYEIAVAFSELLPDFTPVSAESAANAATPASGLPASGIQDGDLDESTILLLTASITQPLDVLREVFNGNNW